MIRILIAEDSLTTRSLLKEILSSDPEIEVVGQAMNGVEAVELTMRLHPDLVTMDIHMPQMDGLEATKEIMIAAPTPIVIITGSSASRDVEVSMHALRAGALDVLAKPPGPESPAFEASAQRMIATVKAMAQVKVVRHWRAGSAGRRAAAHAGSRRGPVVAIATSTGGPAALQCLLESLPGDFGAPLLVVQHITPGFATGLTAWLNTVCDLRIKIAEHGENLQPHTVYLAPDDCHLGVSGLGTVALSHGPPIGRFRPSANHLFESVAAAYGPATVAVVLTGMGDDGVEGLHTVHKAGGHIIAQDEKTSVVFGMPRAAIVAGLADQVLPLEAIGRRLLELV
jgi:two-component system, chemotaxis family, protein-glutamate methylesterase/glutaminase